MKRKLDKLCTRAMILSLILAVSSAFITVLSILVKMIEPIIDVLKGVNSWFYYVPAIFALAFLLFLFLPSILKLDK
jgi:ABC-type proline/glycine betaine transport system permease subunit